MIQLAAGLLILSAVLYRTYTFSKQSEKREQAKLEKIFNKTEKKFYKEQTLLWADHAATIINNNIQIKNTERTNSTARLAFEDGSSLYLNFEKLTIRNKVMPATGALLVKQKSDLEKKTTQMTFMNRKMEIEKLEGGITRIIL